MQGMSPSIHYRIDFLKYRYFAYIFSATIFIVGLGAYAFFHGFDYHIDFTGGTEIRISFQNPVNISAVRNALDESTVIQSIGNEGKSFLLRMATSNEDIEARVKSSLAQNLPGNQVTVDNIDLIGAEVGEGTTRNAIWAVFLSLLILLLYIAIRSELRFGLGATAALLHDVLVILAFLLITRMQVSLHVLAAVLAVLGYSLNDTIVIFSRIRTNLKKFRDLPEYDIVNLSINQTLTRTILTSVSTFIAVLSILILGGDTLRGLSSVLCMGIVFGTFSSIYIASAVTFAIGKAKSKR